MNSNALCPYRCVEGRVFLETQGYVPCPHCSDLVKVAETVLETTGEDLFSQLRIPPQYRDATLVDEALFRPSLVSNFTPESVYEMKTLFSNINRSLYHGNVYRLSVYFHNPNVIDTRLFVYGAMRFAFEKGLGVCPFVSCHTLYGIQKLGDYPYGTLREASENTNIKEYSPELIAAVDGFRFVADTKLTYYDFVNADLCFIEATANTTDKGWTALADLLSERAKNGLPTYVMGYWSVRYSRGVGGRGLKYLLAPEGLGVHRLDMLIPYELQPKGESGNAPTPIKKVVNVPDARSSVTAGLSTRDLLGG